MRVTDKSIIKYYKNPSSLGEKYRIYTTASNTISKRHLVYITKILHFNNIDYFIFVSV